MENQMTRKKLQQWKKTAALALCALTAWPARAAIDVDFNASANNYHIAWNGSSTSANLMAYATGDLNGDGIEDLVMRENGADTQSRTNNGAFYVVYGVQKSTGGAVRAISSTFDVRIDGASSSDAIGVGVVRDFNNDGQDDLMIRNAGATVWWFLYGPFPSGTGNVIDLANSAKYNLKVSAPAGTSAFYAFAGVDVNGDGIDDTVFEAPLADVTNTDSGSLYVMYGPLPAGTGNTRDLSVTTDWNLRINGPATASAFLTYKSYGTYYDVVTQPNLTMGDVNGDGAPDLIIGASRHDTWGDTDNGSVWVSTGPFPSGTGNSWNVSDAGRFMLRLDGPGDNDGLSRSIVADFNGDGNNDLCVGAAEADFAGRTNNGAVFCLYGPLNYPVDSTLDLGQTQNYNVVFYDATSWDLGYSGFQAVDANNDGFKDLVASSYIGDPNSTDSGVVYIFYGGSAGSWPAAAGNQKDITTATNYNVKIVGNEANDILGVWPTQWRDFNGDGALDFLVESRGESGSDACGAGYQSQASVFYGPTAAGTGQTKNILSNYDLRFRYSNCSHFGDGPLLSGDFDGDGVSDVALSYYYHDGPGGADAGRVYYVGLSSYAARVTAPNLFTNSTTPTVSWAAGSGASNYWLQVANDPLFTAGSIVYENNNVTGTSQATSALSNGGSYYARVKANNGNHQFWGPVASFTVDTTAPTAPTLLTPGDASQTHPSVGTQTPEFDWTDASTE
jgi:hypothetical protein